MDIVRLKPFIKDYIWGGTLFSEWGKVPAGRKAAECWELSFHKDGLTTVAGGKDGGKYLCDVVNKSDTGRNSLKFPFFPVLIKLIDAHDNLSVQVHPDDEYALKHENSFGKTEMWYVIDGGGGGLYIGFREKQTVENVRRAIADGTVMQLMNFYPVKRGDCFTIPAGTLHAIGKGVTVCEVQQNSNITYRVYDYNRTGADGRKRELHIEKAMAVLDTDAYSPREKISCGSRNLLSKCGYFTAYECGSSENGSLFNNDSFMCITFVSGEGTVTGENVMLPYKKGDSFFIPCGKRASVCGTGTYILTQVD